MFICPNNHVCSLSDALLIYEVNIVRQALIDVLKNNVTIEIDLSGKHICDRIGMLIVDYMSAAEVKVNSLNLSSLFD